KRGEGGAQRRMRGNGRGESEDAHIRDRRAESGITGTRHAGAKSAPHPPSAPSPRSRGEGKTIHPQFSEKRKRDARHDRGISFFSPPASGGVSLLLLPQAGGVSLFFSPRAGRRWRAAPDEGQRAWRVRGCPHPRQARGKRDHGNPTRRGEKRPSSAFGTFSPLAGDTSLSLLLPARGEK